MRSRREGGQWTATSQELATWFWQETTAGKDRDDARRKFLRMGAVVPRTHHVEPFAFELELDRRGVKLLGLHCPCACCGDCLRERAGDLCRVCQEYRETMNGLWR